tara:strand:+ start:52 stop:264 length:213 start_codon:yes stop_codon:yes gene_type:complete
MDLHATGTIQDLAAHFSISVSTARKWVRDGKIPLNTYFKVDSVYRFDIPAVQAALQAANTATTHEDTQHD